MHAMTRKNFEDIIRNETNQTHTQNKYRMISLLRSIWSVNFIEAENGRLFGKGLWEVGHGNECIMGTEFPFGMMK